MKLNKQRLNGRGFTLVELLVVIAITTVLAALSFAVVSKVIAKSRTVTSVNNLKQLYIAAESFAMDNRDTFPATYLGYTENGYEEQRDWWSALAPYLYGNYNEEKNEVDGMFRDKADPRVKSISDEEWRVGTWEEISYVPWLNDTINPDSSRVGISLARTDSLSGQPYLSTGVVNADTSGCASLADYTQHVAPSAAWRDDAIIVLYCNGAVQAIKNPTFEKVAPAMAEEEG